MSSPPSQIGPYRVVGKLGEGGMGAVYEAVHEAIERRVAIKILHAEYAKNSEFTARFFNEARAVNRVNHPGLVQVSDYGQLPDGTAYIVMEYLRGDSLAARLKRSGGALPTADATRLALMVADSLAAAHDKGIVHRDLKPENVMVVADPTVPGGERTKLLDFGIAKVKDEKGFIKTATNTMMGTPTYMSPEQCRGAGGVDDRSDVYSFGVMLFVMLSGRPPFDGEGLGEIIGKHMYVPAPALDRFAPSAPPPIIRLVDRLLAKDKVQRPSMRQVVEEMGALAREWSITGIPAGQAIAPENRGRIRAAWVGVLGGVTLVATVFAVGVRKARPTQAASALSVPAQLPDMRPSDVAARTQAAASSNDRVLPKSSPAVPLTPRPVETKSPAAGHVSGAPRSRPTAPPASSPPTPKLQPPVEPPHVRRKLED